MKRLLLAAAALGSSVAPLGAHAADSSDCTGQRPWVEVSSSLGQELGQAVQSELRAGLEPSRIDVCRAGAGPATEPLARVALREVGDGGARYGVDVTDSVTHTRVGRDLSLQKLPADGRALGLAVAAEELLRASWAELGLRGVRSPDNAPPPRAQAIAEEAPPSPPPPKSYAALGARLTFERFLGGQTHYGADAFGVAPLPFGAGIGLSLGVRRGLSERAPHGTIAARGLSSELWLSLRVLRSTALELGVALSTRVLWLTFTPAATMGNVADSRSGPVVTSRAGALLALGRLGVLRSYSSLGVGVPLRSFTAADDGVAVTGAAGLELFVTTGLAFELP